LTKLAKHNNMI